MAIIDVVKCEMQNGEFCSKFPSDKLKIGTQLVVYSNSINLISCYCFFLLCKV